MTRTAFVLAAGLAVAPAGPAAAQGLVTPFRPAFGSYPPGPAFGPGTPAPLIPPYRPDRRPVNRPPVIIAPGWGPGWGWGGGFGYGPGFYPNNAPSAVVTPPPPLQGAGGGAPVAPVRSGEFVASLAVSLPVPGDLWVDGTKQAGSGPTFGVTSPALAPGHSYQFDVRAEWRLDGRRYGVSRKMTVGAGERQKLTLIIGDPLPAAGR